MNRLYAQYQPDEAAASYLLELQQMALTANADARLVSAAQIHLTIIHFGIIDEVFAQLQAIVPDVSYETYRQAIDSFVSAVEQAMPVTVESKLQSWELFGVTQRTLVVTLELTRQLKQIHGDSLAALRHFFITCGLQDPEAFMAGNQNFQYALTLKPHITLLKNAPNVPNASLMPKKLHLQRMPILYD